MARHRHVFVDFGARYYPPIDGLEVTMTGMAHTLEKVLWGWTVIYQRCECAEYRTQEVIGKLCEGDGVA